MRFAFKVCAALLLVLLVLGAASPARAQARFNFDATPGRLSKQVVPTHYRLALDLDPARDTFAATVAIALRVRQPTSAIELHAHELVAVSARLVSGHAARALTVTPLAAAQMWRLAPVDGAPIDAGEHRIEIAYTGSVHVAGNGLFRAPYRVAGQPRQMLATQLEPIFARTLFPGFDEPAFRAAFELSVRVPREFDVVSNMPRASRTPDGDHALHRFAATPPMPSYLVSVAVGRFDALAGRAAGVPLRILTAEGKRAQGRYALAATRQLLPFYRDYFGVPYALPKLDLLAVPSVRWGAMEDWGLISYAENLLLVDPARSSKETVRDVYDVVAHEVAHQWFGNLVTAASWDEIWLNEAFATWMAAKATDRFNPDWQVPLRQRLPIDRAMTIDAGGATRAIRSGPVAETAVTDVFDPITYAKGGAVLAMLEQWIGARAFRAGLAGYMRERRLSNATAGDLWHHMGRASKLDVTAVASSWTDQPGFPLVEVATRCDGDRLTATLTQSRFALGPAAQAHARGAASAPVVQPDAQVAASTPAAQSDAQGAIVPAAQPDAPGATSAPAAPARWKIPLRLAHGARNVTLLFDTPERRVELGACSAAPLVVNAGGAGFYRVAYASDARRALVGRFAELAAIDRLTLLSDTFALTQAGRVPLADYVALLEALPAVRDASRATLWTVAARQLDFLDVALAGTPAQGPLRETGRALLAGQLRQLGWTPRAGEGELAALRAVLVRQLARFDDAATAEHAARLFDADEAGERALPASLRAAVIYAAGAHADAARFERLLARFKAAGGEEERWTYAEALAAGRDATRAAALLELSLADVAPANVASALPGLVARQSPFGALAYRYTLEHWPALARLAGTWGRLYLLPSVAAGFSDAEQARRLIDDQRRHAGPDGDALAAREAELIRLRAAIRSREGAASRASAPNGRPGG